MTPPAELLHLLEGLPEPRIVLDGEYRIVFANQAYQQRFGQTPLGKTCYAVSHGFHKPCDEMGEACPLQAARQTHLPQRVMHLHQTSHGEEHVAVHIVPILSEQGHTWFVETVDIVRYAPSTPPMSALIGHAPNFLRAIHQLKRVAPTTTAVLLLGESGTGKEVAARAIHQMSPRHNKPFVTVECSGLTEHLFESELFGHEKGSFTGAHQRKIGLIESADGGSLFLDEIGEIPLAWQVKLLRFIETGMYRRVGATEWRHADVRLITATHRDLPQWVQEGKFRADLYYRLTVFPIHLPPLRDRREDLPDLCQHLLSRLYPQRTLVLTKSALTYLYNYPFMGNIRELRNLLERAGLLTDNHEIHSEHLYVDTTPTTPNQSLDYQLVSLAEAEKNYLIWAVNILGLDKPKLAHHLQISERTLYRKLAKLHFEELDQTH